MPDQDDQTTPDEKFEQRQRLFDWINEKWPAKNQRCPICDAIQWTITDIQQTMEFTPNSFRIGGPVIPVIGVMCGNCGYMRWFNALLTGALKPQTPPPEATAKPEGA